MPFHFGGHFQGEDLRSTSTRRAPTPMCSAKACNTAQTYGYDSVTAMQQMQETKATLCKIDASVRRNAV
jgi:formate dehydrogenase major subunit